MTQSKPIIIIGAGRSGTNMLRDILVQIPGLETWPCDEINYIWRHGNRNYPTDQFTREMATDKVSDFIRREFDRLVRRTSATTVVEKTCANSLRCGFVKQVLPDARFIHIVRDGRDVALSANLRWKAKLDVPYILKKARYVPPSDLPWYGSQYFFNRVRRILSREGRLAVWGPRFDGMQEAFTENSVSVACAIQWQACVQSADSQLASLDPSRVNQVRYEDFTDDPQRHLRQICEFLERPINDDSLTKLTAGVSTKSVGQWRKRMTNEELEQIESLVGSTLTRMGYESSKGD